MSCSNEELTTDSIPDVPRQNDANADRKEKINVKEGSQSDKTSKKTKKKEKGDSPPKSKPSMFKGPPSGSGPMNMICISNASNVHIGNSFSINIAQAHQESSKPRMKKPKEVKETIKNTEKVTLDDIDVAAEHVGKEWKKLGEQLGYTDGQIERFYEDYHDIGLKEVVFKMLLDWKQLKSDKALVGVLCEHLWKSQQYDAAVELSKLRYSESEKTL